MFLRKHTFTEWIIGKIVQSDSNGFSRFPNRELRENINDDSDKSSFRPQDQITKDTLNSQTKIETLTIDEAKTSGNGLVL